MRAILSAAQLMMAAVFILVATQASEAIAERNYEGAWKSDSAGIGSNSTPAGRVPHQRNQRRHDGGGQAASHAERPEGCPVRAWCGCFLMHYFELNDRSLWLAREWARKFTRVAGPAVGRIVVWPHHVGVITASSDKPGVWLVLSGNDGRAVRERLRSVHGAIAFVTL